MLLLPGKRLNKARNIPFIKQSFSNILENIYLEHFEEKSHENDCLGNDQIPEGSSARFLIPEKKIMKIVVAVVVVVDASRKK